MRALGITLCTIGITGQGAIIFVSGRFDLLGVAVIGICATYFAWALWDDLD